MLNSGNGVHILVFPFPAQGHMLPLLDLTNQLAIHGLTITILVTPKNLPILHPLLSKHSSIQTLVLPFPNYPTIPPGAENMKDVPFQLFPAMIHAMGELRYPVLNWFQSTPSPPVAILSDVFLGWTHHLASQLGIPRIAFAPVGARTISIVNCLWRDLPKRDDPNNPSCPISFPKLPNSPVVPWNHFASLYRNYVAGDPVWDFIKECMLSNIASWGIVFNSFTELEGVYFEHMKKDLGHDRVWAVGPLLPLEDSVGPIERGGPSSIQAQEVMSWLDSCEAHSVVYVCFGSQVELSKLQMEKLAAGLEGSRAQFIWCVKETTRGRSADEYNVVPVGFEKQIKGRGLVIKGWAPQVAILRHRAVGTYLTHCGWNSAIEGLIAGVQLVAWPMDADHFSNTTLLVDEMGAAVKACEGPDTIPNSAELAQVLADSVKGTRPQRGRAMELSRAALEGIKIGGCSFKELTRLVKEVCDRNLMPN